MFTWFGSWDAGGSYWFSHSSNWVERYNSLHLPAGKRSGSDIFDDDYQYDSPAPAGAYRTASVTTSTHFPAGASVLVYAATFQELYAGVNDTSVDAVINDSWYVNGISVDRVS